MGNKNTGGGISGRRIGGYGLCLLSIVVWLLMALGILVRIGVLDEIAWLAQRPGGWPVDIAVGVMCFMQGWRILHRPTEEAAPPKSEGNSGAKE